MRLAIRILAKLPAENSTFSPKIRQSAFYALHLFHLCQHLADIAVRAERACGDLRRADCLPGVDADIGGGGVLGCHAPERVFDDGGGVIAYAQLQKQQLLALMTAQEVAVAPGGGVPAALLTVDYC